MQLLLTDADVRYEYTVSLHDIYNHLQMMWDKQAEDFFLERPEYRNDPVYQAGQEFMCEMLDSCDCEWTCGNTFKLTMLDLWPCDLRILKLLRQPNTRWLGPSVKPAVVDSSGQLALEITITVVDSEEELGYHSGPCVTIEEGSYEAYEMGLV